MAIGGKIRWLCALNFDECSEIYKSDLISFQKRSWNDKLINFFGVEQLNSNSKEKEKCARKIILTSVFYCQFFVAIVREKTICILFLNYFTKQFFCSRFSRELNQCFSTGGTRTSMGSQKGFKGYATNYLSNFSNLKDFFREFFLYSPTRDCCCCMRGVEDYCTIDIFFFAESYSTLGTTVRPEIQI